MGLAVDPPDDINAADGYCPAGHHTLDRFSVLRPNSGNVGVDIGIGTRIQPLQKTSCDIPNIGLFAHAHPLAIDNGNQ